MSIDIKVPPMGESVTEATVARWFKKPGEAVKRDEPLLELETDKVTVEVPSPADGAIESIAAPQGATVAVGALLGAIAEGEAGSAPAPKTEAPKPAPAPAAPAPKAPEKTAEAPAMPSAARIAAESGLSTVTIAGTGKDGRVTKGDMLGALAARAAAPAPAPTAPSGPRHNEAREEKVAMTRLRKTIALRLKESQNTAAQLTTFNEVDMSHVMAMRTQYKDSFEKKHGVKMGFMGFFTKAVVAALKELPNVNAEIEGDNIVYKNYYDIGIAHHRHHQAALGRDRDAQVVIILVDDVVAFDLGIDGGDFLQRRDAGLDEETHEAQPYAVTLFEAVLVFAAHRHDAGHVHFVEGGELGGGVL